MATSPDTINALLGQLDGLAVRARKMFGEYGLYCGEKIVGLVCRDQLFVKITDAGLALIEEPTYAPAYPGSKDFLLIDQDAWYEGDWLKQLIVATADQLPAPKPKKHKTLGDLPYIGAPAANALAAIGVTSVSQLQEFTEKDLLAIHGIGPKAVRILRETGAKLKDDR